MITIFETWNDDTIDKSLFLSGRAKHNPKVKGDIIEYKTDNGGKYVARIKKLSNGKFLCKVYRVKDDGSRIRIRKKVKKTLSTAHNFIREFLNDRVEDKTMRKSSKKKDKKEKKSEDSFDELFVDVGEPDFSDSSFDFSELEKPRKTIIRRFT